MLRVQRANKVPPFFLILYKCKDMSGSGYAFIRLQGIRRAAGIHSYP
jgi:hypothetical protein